MKPAAMILALLALAACGADGYPEKPEVSAETTLGYNSESGSFQKSRITLFFGL